MTQRNHFPLLLIIIFILLASALSDAATINPENATTPAPLQSREELRDQDQLM